MNDIPPKRGDLPFLSDDIILKILVKADPKTVGKCRSLSKAWNSRLCTNLFIKQNYKETKDRDRSVIVGIGSPPSDQNSMWYVRASVDTGRQFNFNVPIEINHYGFYSILGSNHGVICLRISMGGLNSRLLMWNPLTRKRRVAPDEASKHCCHVVSLFAFGYLEDSVEYHIVHVHKRHYSDSTMSWSLYSSVEREWTHEGSFESNVQKLGPKSVVDNGVVYWIGWERPNFPEPEIGCNDSVKIAENVADIKTNSDNLCILDVVEEAVSSLKCMTPAKRALNGVKSSTITINENEEGQLSTNKFSRKGGKKQKSQLIDVAN
ncbi:putative F-box protein At1g46840 [Arachis ipaensis]|uniref:putative F-box protein At1g46840 n=1 Tax=Arachis ipaensis TaxID=130454 RepID=UPI0007AF8940|nr:putative F-box protein At1g46840 [Arachis ipaensis]